MLINQSHLRGPVGAGFVSIGKTLIRLALAGKASSNQHRIAVAAALRDDRAAADRVPSGVSPFNLRFITHLYYLTPQ